MIGDEKRKCWVWENLKLSYHSREEADTIHGTWRENPNPPSLRSHWEQRFRAGLVHGGLGKDWDFLWQQMSGENRGYFLVPGSRELPHLSPVL